MTFIIFRSIATGMGEACFGSANYSTIADWHDESTRGRAMSIHQTSYYFGVIVSGALAGWIADEYGWRSAFYIFGAAGVVLGALMVWRLKDKFVESSYAPIALKENGRDDSLLSTKESECVVGEPTFFDGIKLVISVPTAVCLTLAFAGLIFVLQGYLTWSTFYLQEKFAMSNAAAGFNAMFYTHISAFLGILLAGWLSDKVAKKSPRGRILMQAIGLLVACPFIVLMGIADSLTFVYIGFVGFGFWRAAFDANTYSVLYDVIPRRFHATAAGAMLFFGFGVGSFAPFILGFLKPVLGLSLGISLLAIVWIFAAALLLFAYKYFYVRDMSRAEKIDNL